MNGTVSVLQTEISTVSIVTEGEVNNMGIQAINEQDHLFSKFQEIVFSRAFDLSETKATKRQEYQKYDIEADALYKVIQALLGDNKRLIQDYEETNTSKWCITMEQAYWQGLADCMAIQRLMAGPSASSGLDDPIMLQVAGILNQAKQLQPTA